MRDRTEVEQLSELDLLDLPELLNLPELPALTLEANPGESISECLIQPLSIPIETKEDQSNVAGNIHKRPYNQLQNPSSQSGDVKRQCLALPKKPINQVQQGSAGQCRQKIHPAQQKRINQLKVDPGFHEIARTIILNKNMEISGIANYFNCYHPNDLKYLLFEFGTDFESLKNLTLDRFDMLYPLSSSLPLYSVLSNSPVNLLPVLAGKLSRLFPIKQEERVIPRQAQRGPRFNAEQQRKLEEAGYHNIAQDIVNEGKEIGIKAFSRKFKCHYEDIKYFLSRYHTDFNTLSNMTLLEFKEKYPDVSIDNSSKELIKPRAMPTPQILQILSAGTNSHPGFFRPDQSQVPQNRTTEKESLGL